MKITVCDLFNDEKTQAVAPTSRIEFGEGINRITVSVVDGALHISGDAAISVWPRAANLVWIKSEWKR